MQRRYWKLIYDTTIGRPYSSTYFNITPCNGSFSAVSTLQPEIVLFLLFSLYLMLMLKPKLKITINKINLKEILA